MIFGAGPIPFLICLSLGLGLGLVYIGTLFGIKKLKINKIFVAVFEFLFVILSAFLYYLVCFKTLEGKFRLFTLIGLGLGVWIAFGLVKGIKIIVKRTLGKH